MGSYEFLKLKDNLRSALGNGLTDQTKELVKRLLSEYKNNPQHKTGRMGRHGVISSKNFLKCLHLLFNLTPD